MIKAAALERIQGALESLHDVATGLDVRDFLVDDETRGAIPGAACGIPEQLFVRHEGDDEFSIALYLDQAIVERIGADPPHEKLHSGNLEAYCVALEGVSHFVLVTSRAMDERQVSGLELELQAEVDKFVRCWELLTEQGVGRRAGADLLLDRLFDGAGIRDEVPSEERERYATASRFARRYCEGLAGRFAAHTPDQVRGATRAFFRRDLAEKLRLAA